MDDTQEAAVIAKKISDYNSANLINFRINNLWIDANKHSRSGLYGKWNADLDCLWDELAGDVQKDSSEEKEYDKLNKDVSEKLIELPTKSDPLVDYTKEQKKKFTEIYIILRKKSIFLRRLLNAQGKGTKYPEDDDFE